MYLCMDVYILYVKCLTQGWSKLNQSRNKEIILLRSSEGESRNRELPIVLNASNNKITGKK